MFRGSFRHVETQASRCKQSTILQTVGLCLVLLSLAPQARAEGSAQYGVDQHLQDETVLLVDVATPGEIIQVAAGNKTGRESNAACDHPSNLCQLTAVVTSPSGIETTYVIADGTPGWIDADPAGGNGPRLGLPLTAWTDDQGLLRVTPLRMVADTAGVWKIQFSSNDTSWEGAAAGPKAGMWRPWIYRSRRPGGLAPTMRPVGQGIVASSTTATGVCVPKPRPSDPSGRLHSDRWYWRQYGSARSTFDLFVYIPTARDPVTKETVRDLTWVAKFEEHNGYYWSAIANTLGWPEGDGVTLPGTTPTGATTCAEPNRFRYGDTCLTIPEDRYFIYLNKPAKAVGEDPVRSSRHLGLNLPAPTAMDSRRGSRLASGWVSISGNRRLLGWSAMRSWLTLTGTGCSIPGKAMSSFGGP